ncbi:MAG: NFACT family protein, partial [Nanoarchaeota archaeon]|nr:NFACT family protein [Nanoarchaeota archaeon]
QELQFLVGGKIAQIYQPEKKEILLQIHVPQRGKQLLKIMAGKGLFLTEQKEIPLQPFSFCLQLRKHLDNAALKELQQQDAERIIIFTLEKKQRYFLIIELFAKGNVILADENRMILGVLEQQRWKDRTIKVNEKYVFPTPGINWKMLTEKQLKELLQKSEKKNLAMALATDLGWGGLYAEELCRRAEIEKEKVPKSISEKEVKKLFDSLQEILRELQHPQGYQYEQEITPFPLLGKTPLKETATYGELLSLQEVHKKPSPYEQKIATLQKMIALQEATIAGLQEKIITETKKGERLYEEYAPVQELLQKARQIRQEKGWEAVKEGLQKEKHVISVNLQTKKMVIDI